MPARLARLPRTKQRERYLPPRIYQMIDVAKAVQSDAAKSRLCDDASHRFCSRNLSEATVGKPRVVLSEKSDPNGFNVKIATRVVAVA
jgi:hypothetical protein